MEHRNHTTIRLLVFAFTLLTACAASTTTKLTTETNKPATAAASPTTTTTAAPPTTTTAPPTTAATAAPTTTAATAAPTTTAPPTLGADCTGKPSGWCNGIDGASCISDSCDCTTGYFKFNSTTCLSVTDLKPVILEVTDANNSLTITWKLNTSVASSSFTYEVQAKNVDNSSNSVDCVLLNPKLSSVCSGLQSGAKYEVKVTVKYTVNGRDLSQSDTKNESLVPADPGSSFTNPTLTAPNVTLSWPPSAGRVDIYSINVKGTDIADVNENTADASYTVRGLTAGSNYSVEIVAISYNKMSNVIKYHFRTDTAEPGPPTKLTVTATVSGDVLLSWLPPSDPNGDIVGYLLCNRSRVYIDMVFEPDSCTSLPNVTAYNVTDLSAGTFYAFSVYTINDKYNSTESANGTTRTQESVPEKVSNLEAPVGNTSVNLNWERPSKPNGDIVAYIVSWHQTGETNESSICLTTPSFANKTGLCLSNSPDINIEKNQKTLSYSIDNLEAYTNYTVSVTAYTQKGGGPPFSKTVLTSIAAPDVVTDVIATVLNSTAVNVSWTIPTTNPGPVKYMVSTYDNVFNNMSNQSCEVPEYTSTSCVVTELEEFWKYKFEVVVETAAAKSTGVNSSEVVTLSGKPRNPSYVSYKTYNSSSKKCDATRVTVFWTEPKLLERNTNITKYKFESTKLGPFVFTVDSPSPWSNVNRNFTKDFIVKADTPYTLKLYAVGEKDEKGMETSINVTTGTCPPPDWSDVDLAQINKTEQGTTSVTINLQNKLFTNDTQGQITSKGLIVVPEKSNFYKDKDGIKFEDLRFWKASSSSSFTTEYRIELPTDNTIRSDKTFIVGGDQKCEDETNEFCNGPLPESWKFKLAIYSCTKPTMCTISSYVGPFATAAVPVTAPPSIAWIIALAIAIVLIIAAGSFVFLWYRGIIDPKKWIGKKDSDREEQENFTELEKKIHRPRPIKIADYFTVLEDMHRDTNLQFSDQYDDITKLGDLFKDQSNTIAAKQESNTAKNRWVNILPYDHSRVKLQQIDDDDPTSDYINANYMPGFNTQREYIATQGPLPGTVDDFWRLVWEQNVRVIVMLTQCKEGNREEKQVKCEKYWPDELREPKQYGDVVVNPVSISQLDKYNISIFYVTVNNSTHQVIHFHYLDFPDFSANVEFDHFIEFVRTVRNHVPHDMTGPMIVHCSAGVGRTGTFICVDRLQLYLNSPQFNENDSIDIFDMVVELRKNRVYMVQTESQYIMIHDCFEKMLADKKAALQVSDSMENLYANDAFDPFPEVVYENVESEQQRTEL